jgi:hypothetical protein
MQYDWSVSIEVRILITDRDRTIAMWLGFSFRDFDQRVVRLSKDTAWRPTRFAATRLGLIGTEQVARNFPVLGGRPRMLVMSGKTSCAFRIDIDRSLQTFKFR